MYTLAVDSSTSLSSVVVLENSTVRAQLIQTVHTTHSDCLMPAIETVLQCAGIDREELDQLVVCRGPGSFSGLRIGIAAMNGLAMALKVPLFSFVNLDLMALQFSWWRGVVCPVVDARKGQLYWALYATGGPGSWEKISDYAVDDPEVVVSRLQTADALIVGPGVDGYRGDLTAAAAEPLHLLGLPAGMMNLALVNELLPGADRETDGENTDRALVLPLYIRPSDAEINLAKRHAGQENRRGQ